MENQNVLLNTTFTQNPQYIYFVVKKITNSLDISLLFGQNRFILLLQRLLDLPYIFIYSIFGLEVYTNCSEQTATFHMFKKEINKNMYGRPKNDPFRTTIHKTHSHTMTPFDAPGKQAFRKHCCKRRNCS